jgi:hypothetical protein
MAPSNSTSTSEGISNVKHNFPRQNQHRMAEKKAHELVVEPSARSSTYVLHGKNFYSLISCPHIVNMDALPHTSTSIMCRETTSRCWSESACAVSSNTIHVPSCSPRQTSSIQTTDRSTNHCLVETYVP